MLIIYYIHTGFYLLIPSPCVAPPSSSSPLVTTSLFSIPVSLFLLTIILSFCVSVEMWFCRHSCGRHFMIETSGCFPSVYGFYLLLNLRMSGALEYLLYCLWWVMSEGWRWLAPDSSAAQWPSQHQVQSSHSQPSAFYFMPWCLSYLMNGFFKNVE